MVGSGKLVVEVKRQDVCINNLRLPRLGEDHISATFWTHE